ncbi:hypothetical protein WDW89_14100 [Deltaproteobacteria bacterium TL4]
MNRSQVIKIFVVFGLVIGIWGTNGLMAQDQEIPPEEINQCLEYHNECKTIRAEDMQACESQYEVSGCEGDTECIQNINLDKKACLDDANENYNHCVSGCQQ